MDRERQGRDGPSTKRLPKRSFALRGLCSQKLPFGRWGTGDTVCLPRSVSSRLWSSHAGEAGSARRDRRCDREHCLHFANVNRLGRHIAAGRSGLSIALRCRASKAKSTLLLYGAKGRACARNARTVLKYGVLGYTNQTPNCIFRRNHPLCELVGFANPRAAMWRLGGAKCPKAGFDSSLRKVINLRSQGNAPAPYHQEGTA